MKKINLNKLKPNMDIVKPLFGPHFWRKCILEFGIVNILKNMW